MDLEPNKRARLSAPPEPSSTTAASVTQVSDSVIAQSIPTSANEAAGPSIQPAKEGVLTDEALITVPTPKLDSSAGSGPSTEMKSIQEQAAALPGLQFRFEEVVAELRIARNDLTVQTAHLEALQKNLTKRDETIAKFKEERTELRKQLADLSDALKSSDIPSVTERERLRTELIAAIAEKEKAESRLKAGEKQFEYTRAEYINASTSATELSAENVALQARVKELEKAASGEALRLKQLVMKDREQAWEEDSERQRSKIKDMERLVSRLHEEIRTLKNSRGVGTRQGSMPRSPRLGPASRVGSPAPTGLGIGSSKLRG